MLTLIRISCVLVIATLNTIPAAAKEKVDPAGYPELAQDVLLPVIMARLKHELPDPQSIRDFVMCPANAIRLQNGKPDFWGVQLEFNTKNEAGGYTGIKAYNVVFRKGGVSGPITSSMFAGNTGLEGILNRSIDRYFERCPAVAEATVQAALQVK